ncbi:MAG: GNAT family N-acetyltransferase [Actinomycetota bacterium]|nr:GNAT family N-acetyltransferase [Actinomycetota bacterium]
MAALDAWCPAQPLTTERLELQPLRSDDADEMAPLLGDLRLHAFIGGTSETREQLRARFERQVEGRSPNRSERWFNWIVRLLDNSVAVGLMQATVRQQNCLLVGEVAWVIGVEYQGHGYAGEAAQAMVAWLEQQGLDVVIAHIHPQHMASSSVARVIGLAPTSAFVDGEVRWERSIHDLPKN